MTAPSSLPAEGRIESLKREIGGGWRALVGGGFGLALGLPMFLYLQGLFVRPLASEFGWTRGEIAAGATLGLVGIGAVPAMGWLADRFGARRVATAALSAMALSFALSTRLSGAILEFYCLLAAINTLGAGATAIVLTKPIATAFDKARGTALGLGIACSTLIIMALAPTVQFVIAAYGWRSGFAALAMASGSGAIVCFALLAGEHRPASAGRGAMASRPSGEAVIAVVRDGRFWLLVAALLGANISFGGLLNQLPALLADRGMASAGIGVSMSALTGSVAVGRLMEGLAVDRIRPSLVSGCFLLLPIGGLMLLGSAPGEAGTTVPALVLIGLGLGAEGTMIAFMVGSFFGLRAFSLVYGLLSIPIAVALATGSNLYGTVHDLTGTYDLAIWLSAVGFAAASGAMFATGLPRWERPSPKLDTAL